MFMVEEKNKFQEEIKKMGLENYFKRVSQLPLIKKIGELERLEIVKKGLEQEISGIDIKILSIQNITDVAEYRAINDEYAMAFLQELREKGASSTCKLMESYDVVTKIPIFRYMDMLKTAKLIEMKIDPSNKSDQIIRVTERGKEVQYTGKY